MTTPTDHLRASGIMPYDFHPAMLERILRAMEGYRGEGKTPNADSAKQLLQEVLKKHYPYIVYRFDGLIHADLNANVIVEAMMEFASTTPNEGMYSREQVEAAICMGYAGRTVNQVK